MIWKRRKEFLSPFFFLFMSHGILSRTPASPEGTARMSIRVYREEREREREKSGEAWSSWSCNKMLKRDNDEALILSVQMQSDTFLRLQQTIWLLHISHSSTLSWRDDTIEVVIEITIDAAHLSRLTPLSLHKREMSNGLLILHGPYFNCISSLLVVITRLLACTNCGCAERGGRTDAA